MREDTDRAAVELLKRLGENETVPNMGGVAYKRHLGKVRMIWRDGSHVDLTSKMALRMADAYESCTEACRAAPVQPLRISVLCCNHRRITLEVVPEFDYHGEKTPVIRLSWGDGTFLALHPKTEAAAGIRHYAIDS